MFIYSLNGYDFNTVFIHEKEYTEEEFKGICKEAPLGGLEIDMPYYSQRKIEEYIVEKYGFKPVKYAAEFFSDEDIENEMI